METVIFDGRAEAMKIKEELKNEAPFLGLSPKLAVILVGQNPESLAYVKQKEKACRELGFSFKLRHLPEGSHDEEIKRIILTLNSDPSVNGIILQLPLPPHLNKKNQEKLTNLILSSKDIDGLTQDTPFTPPVALAVYHVIQHINLHLESANAVVLGRGLTAGKPISQLLERLRAKVTVLHSQSQKSDVTHHLSTADIIVSCVGKPNLIKGEMIKEGAVVIGVGISKITDGVERILMSDKKINDQHSPKARFVGDLDELSLIGKAYLVTPTPGGIGPLTVAYLLENLLLSAKKQSEGNHTPASKRSPSKGTPYRSPGDGLS